MRIIRTYTLNVSNQSRVLLIEDTLRELPIEFTFQNISLALSFTCKLQYFFCWHQTFSVHLYIYLLTLTSFVNAEPTPVPIPPLFSLRLLNNYVGNAKRRAYERSDSDLMCHHIQTYVASTCCVTLLALRELTVSTTLLLATEAI